MYEADQPYFPSQIVFTTDNGYIIAVDQINQRAYQSINFSSTEQQTSFVMKHFPYTTPGTPESKYYVQLLLDSTTSPASCQYATYWKYGTDYFNQFPSHWWSNASSFEIENYIYFSYEMIHSSEPSVDEDYWYSNEQCRLESGELLPCEEISFIKYTQVPIRSTRVVRHDINLGVTYDPQTIPIDVNQTVTVRTSLTAPPHQINGNDTVRIQWREAENDSCFKWSPRELVFNGKNFQKVQTLTITRVKDGSSTRLLPIFNGGGFDQLPSDDYPIIIL